MQLEIDVTNFNLAMEYYKKENYEGSVWYLTRAIEDNHLISFSKAHLWRGLSHFLLANYDKAIQDFDEASLGIYNELRIHNWRALSYKKTGNYLAAIEDFKKAIEIEVKFREAYVELYELGFLTENDSLSNEYFIKLVELGTDNINQFVARAEKNGKDSRHDLAIKMCDFILGKISNEINSLTIRGACNASLMNYGLALNDFSKIIELAPKDAIAYFNRAVLLKELKRDGAYQDFLKAYELGMTEAKDYL